jgi:ribonuclease D
LIVAVELHKGDLRAGLSFGDSVAVDTETMGLVSHRDRLCLVQLAGADGVCHIVQFPKAAEGVVDYSAPNLKVLLSNPAVTKLFHFARFDLAAISRYLAVESTPVYCTKIASRLVRTFTDRHGLKDLCRDLLGIELSKQMQSSDWGRETLSRAQLDYAAQDVLHLHRLRAHLDGMLEREGRTALAAECFRFLPSRAALDLAGWPESDIFAH